MAEDPVAAMLRWEESGALWSVISRRGTEITVGLFRCDGGGAGPTSEPRRGVKHAVAYPPSLLR